MASSLLPLHLAKQTYVACLSCFDISDYVMFSQRTVSFKRRAIKVHNIMYVSVTTRQKTNSIETTTLRSMNRYKKKHTSQILKGELSICLSFQGVSHGVTFAILVYENNKPVAITNPRKNKRPIPLRQQHHVV